MIPCSSPHKKVHPSYMTLTSGEKEKDTRDDLGEFYRCWCILLPPVPCTIKAILCRHVLSAYVFSYSCVQSYVTIFCCFTFKTSILFIAFLRCSFPLKNNTHTKMSDLVNFVGKSVIMTCEYWFVCVGSFV